MSKSKCTHLFIFPGQLLLPVFLLITFLLFTCSEPVEKRTYKIGFSQCVSDDLWRQTMHQEMRREIFFYQDALSLEIKDAGGDNAQQIRHIGEFIESGVDLLMVSPNESAPITPVVEMAFNKGIPVIILDRRISSGLFTAFVGADNHEIGRIAGRYVDELVQPGDKVVQVWGLAGSSPASARNEGFISALNTPDLEVVNIYADWTRGNAITLLRDQFEQVEDARVVFAHNDQMALGAYEVFKESRKEQQCAFIGVDALAGPGGGLQMVHDGILHATFLYPTGGDVAVRTAYNILLGLPYEKENPLQTTVIDAANVRIMKLQTDEILSKQKEIERQQNRIEDQLRIYQNQQIALYGLLGFLTLSILLGAYALYALRENRLANKSLKARNEMISTQKEEIERIATLAEEATNAKVRFFTNISHEFRTPLTLILGPIGELINHEKLRKDREIIKEMQLIRKNSLRLLRLVNQLMAFRKIEDDKLYIKVAEYDLVAFVKEMVSGFESVAKKEHIDLDLTANSPVIKLWFDRNWLDKVIFNLLSNAFKFTGKSGFIHIRIHQDLKAGQVRIEVEDNGKGMTDEQARHAFDRFYSGLNADFGTGLGLALSREIIHLHKGSITVKSEKNVGTEFTIMLKTGRDHFSDLEIATQEVMEDFMVSLPDEAVLIRPEHEDHLYETDKRATILIIEDNQELCDLLRRKLKQKYHVLTAPDGDTGLETAVLQIPDIVICDVMIPGKDGLTVTKNLKTDNRTSHIPVILLTAKSEAEEQLSGIRAGADVYITKPFDFNFLEENIHNLLQIRAMLKSRYLNEAYSDQEASEHISKPIDPDKQFVDNFKRLVKARLQDSGFGVNELCEELGFSRMQLYRKVKVLLGSSVNEYINTMRLRKAHDLLAHSDLAITEVADECGFASPTYFSTAFKAYYKVTPSEIRKAG